jgi:hypothetical protein
MSPRRWGRRPARQKGSSALPASGRSHWHVDPQPVLTGFGSICDLSGESLWHNWVDDLEVEPTAQALRQDWLAVGSCLQEAANGLRDDPNVRTADVDSLLQLYGVTPQGLDRTKPEGTALDDEVTQPKIHEAITSDEDDQVAHSKIYVLDDDQVAQPKIHEAITSDDDQVAHSKIYVVLNEDQIARAQWKIHEAIISARQWAQSQIYGIHGDRQGVTSKIHDMITSGNRNAQLKICVIADDQVAQPKIFVVLNDDPGVQPKIRDFAHDVPPR